MTAASLQFLEPTRKIWSLHIFDRKYIKEVPLETLDLVKLLSQGNSEEAVLYEMKVATNVEARRELYIKSGAPASVLREIRLEPTNNARQTNASFHWLRDD
jgi:hypothetical protein